MRKLNNVKIYSNLGFSLVEVMITAGIVSLIALTVAKVSQNANKSVVKVKTDIELLEFQNYLKSRLLNQADCTASDFGVTDMTGGTTTSTLNPIGVADNTTEYTTVSNMRIGDTTRPFNLVVGDPVSGFPSWTMDEMRVYDIVELPAPGSNEGVCTLLFRVNRLGGNTENRSTGVKDKTFSTQLSCRLDPATNEIQFCAGLDSVAEGYWEPNNDTNLAHGINYPDNVVLGAKSEPGQSPLAIYPDAINSTTWFGSVMRGIHLPVNASINFGNNDGYYSDGGCLRARQTGADRLSICGGNIGVGVAVPDSPLQVGSNIRLGRAALPRIEFTGTGRVESSGATIFTNSGAETLRIQASGNVGIGTTTASAKLHVAGDIAIDSDRRFKKQIKSLNNSLERLSQVRGVRYFMRVEDFPKRGFSSEEKFGVIAQEIENVFPELVFTGSNGYKSVNYQGFIPLLIEGQKELIKALEDEKVFLLEKVNELEKRNELILKRLDRLEAER